MTQPTPPPHLAGTIPDPSHPILSAGLNAPSSFDPEIGHSPKPQRRTTEPRQIRLHPDSGYPAVHFDGQLTGGGAHWLYVHTDDHGQVVATPMDDDGVKDWASLERREDDNAEG